MATRGRRIGVALAAVALVAGVSIGAAEAAKSGGQGTKQARSFKAMQRAHDSALKKIAAALGVTTAELRKALEANRPERPEHRGPEALAADLAKELGVETSAVQEILEANRPDGAMGRGHGMRGAHRGMGPGMARGMGPGAMGGRHGGPMGGPGAPCSRGDESALVKALADGLDKSETEVAAAFEAIQKARQDEHDTRHDAMYAAVAEALGKTTDEVREAFEANRPARPTR